ncbi:energy transducer TonB [Tahibacter harae]|uniref:TonB family protein n=1 Tax=Tahibacter harae TaxID=2963937 RepID=A0ABT1QX99_9GAMM|nr:energy transducer TonB [Tahibacter harae]MCQ4166911.1 TonB family protein [Tahibacter harae]
MTSAVLTQGFQWKRSSAISVTLALHGLALIAILAPPAYVAVERAAPAPVLAVTVKKEEPPPPPPPKDLEVVKFKPKAAVRPQPVPRPAPVQPVITQETTPMSTPAIDTPPEPGPVEAAPVEPALGVLAYRSRTTVPYPRESTRAKEEGTVILRVLVGVDGVPQEIEIARSSGYARLDRQAKNSVMKWRFEPGTRNGQPIAAYGLVPVAFKLTEL